MKKTCVENGLEHFDSVFEVTVYTIALVAVKLNSK